MPWRCGEWCIGTIAVATFETVSQGCLDAWPVLVEGRAPRTRECCMPQKSTVHHRTFAPRLQVAVKQVGRTRRHIMASGYAKRLLGMENVSHRPLP
jgi:hypothetical protein